MQPDPTSPLDLDARAQKWLVGCPIHDAGIPGTCRCPEDDPRTIIRDRLAARDDGRKAYDDLLDLFEEQVAALAEAQRERDEARDAQIVVQCDDPEHAERDRMRQELTDAGWSSVADLHAAYVDVLGRWERSEPVVEAARELRAVRPHQRRPLPPGTTKEELFAMVEAYAPIARAWEAAVDTYETQTGGTE